MSRKGRVLEQTIAFIQKNRIFQNVEVKSPDYFIDLETGQKREVDISLKYKSLDPPFLVVLECRDRTASSDVTWIEQLISKRKSISVSKIIAVSNSRFTLPAKNKANLNGIELIELADLPTNLAKTINDPFVSFYELHTRFNKLDLYMDTELETINFQNGLIKFEDTFQMKMEWMRKDVLCFADGKIWGSVRDLFLTVVPRSEWEGLESGDSKEKDCLFDFPNPNVKYYLNCKEGLIPIFSILVSCTLSVEKQLLPINHKVLLDPNNNKVIVSYAEAKLTMSKNSSKLIYVENALGDIEVISTDPTVKPFKY